MEKLDSVIVTLVLKMKEIVIFMMNVKMVFLVDQTIVQHHLVLTQLLIVVIHIQEVNILNFKFKDIINADLRYLALSTSSIYSSTS